MSSADRDLVSKVVVRLHERVGWLGRLALNARQDRIAIELEEIRRELSDLFEKLRPAQ